jgi:hypothetical protein
MNLFATLEGTISINVSVEEIYTITTLKTGTKGVVGVDFCWTPAVNLQLDDAQMDGWQQHTVADISRFASP